MQTLEYQTKLTILFSYEKSSNFREGCVPAAFFHNVIPLPARRRVGTHPVNIVLHLPKKDNQINNKLISTYYDTILK